MTQAAQALRTRLDDLEISDRAEIAEYLLRTLDDGVDGDAEDLWRKELKRRSAEIDAGTVVGEPAEEVFARLRKRYP